MNCFHLKEGGCNVLSDGICSEDCAFRMIDSDKYGQMLKDLMSYAIKKGNLMMARRHYNELKSFYSSCEERFNEWEDVYREEKRRGEKGSHSEGNVNSASLKARMKDNRAPECRIVSRAVRNEIKEALSDFEKDFGKLERLSRNSMSRSKIDSYTGSRIK